MRKLNRIVTSPLTQALAMALSLAMLLYLTAEVTDLRDRVVAVEHTLGYYEVEYIGSLVR